MISESRYELIVAGAVGDRCVAGPQSFGRHDRRRRSGIALTREDVDETSAEWTPSDGGLHRKQSIGEYSGEDFHHLPVAVVGPGKLAPHAVQRRRQHRQKPVVILPACGKLPTIRRT